jgi:MFS family permease
VTRIGVKPVLAVGLTLIGASLLYYTQLPVNGAYFWNLFPGFLLTGTGLGFSFVPVSIAALSGVTGREAGLASGLINTSQQVGGAVGLAILTTVATTRTNTRLAEGVAQPAALTDGFRLAFLVAAGVALVAVITTLLALKRNDLRGRGEVADSSEPEGTRIAA